MHRKYPHNIYHYNYIESFYMYCLPTFTLSTYVCIQYFTYCIHRLHILFARSYVHIYVVMITDMYAYITTYGEKPLPHSYASLRL